MITLRFKSADAAARRGAWTPAEKPHGDALMLPNSAWRSRILLAHTLVMEAVEGQSAFNMRGGNDDRHGYETVAGEARRIEP